MKRLLITVSAVALLSSCLVALENAQGERSPELDWVRTTDGWEPGGVVAPQPVTSSFPAVHPALVASLQLGMSLFFLLAFPPNVSRKGKASASPQLDVGSSLLVGA